MDATAKPTTPDRIDRVSVEPSRPVSGRFAIHSGHLLLLTDVRGRVRARTGGLFFHRTRFLADLEFKVSEKAPSLASISQIGADRLLGYQLAPLPEGAAGAPPGLGPGGGEMGQRGIGLELRVSVSDRLLFELVLINRALEPTTLPLSWRLTADFADQDQTRQGRARPAVEVTRSWRDGELWFRSEHAKLRHATRVRCFGPGIFSDAEGTLRTSVELPPQQPVPIRLEIVPLFLGRRPRPLADLRKRWSAGACRLTAPNQRVQRAWDRAAADLAALVLGQGEGEERFTPAAGSPHYIALFGRDSLMTGRQTLMLNPALLRGSLSLVGRWTAKGYDRRYDAQPGKVLHQRQLSPYSLLGKNPFLHYYGDYSAPGLYLLGIAAAYAQSGNRELLESYQPRAQEILAWLDRDGDLDGDGFYEYETLAGSKGLKNQGWKDSGDAILYPDGSLVPDPIALCEIQALYYAAKRGMAAALRTIAEHGLAEQLEGEAAELRRRFEQKFWMPEENYLALALDPDKRPVRSIASNAGDCLCYGILDPEKAELVARRLMSPQMFSGWGVRTLSADHPAYNPLAYHLGSIWPVENSVIARGLKSYGLHRPLHRLAGALFEATKLFELEQMPELFGGNTRDAAHPHPGIYPDACSPQAWSAGAIISLVSTLAGLKPAAPFGALVVDPALPEWLGELTLADLPLGKGRLTLHFSRKDDGASVADVLENSTGMEVVDRPDGELAAFVETLV